MLFQNFIRIDIEKYLKTIPGLPLVDSSPGYENLIAQIPQKPNKEYQQNCSWTK